MVIYLFLWHLSHQKRRHTFTVLNLCLNILQQDIVNIVVDGNLIMDLVMLSLLNILNLVIHSELWWNYYQTISF